MERAILHRCNRTEEMRVRQNEVIKLVSIQKSVDEYGDTAEESTERILFAELKSIGQSEFYQAQSVGLKPEIKFVIADYLDYQNEQIVKYQPFNGTEEKYSVIRTYRTGNALEIVCKRGVD